MHSKLKKICFQIPLLRDVSRDVPPYFLKTNNNLVRLLFEKISKKVLSRNPSHKKKSVYASVPTKKTQGRIKYPKKFQWECFKLVWIGNFRKGFWIFFFKSLTQLKYFPPLRVWGQHPLIFRKPIIALKGHNSKPHF